MKRADVLRAALEIVEKRGAVYGKPEDNFGRICAFWNAWMSSRYASDGHWISLDETDVSALMIGVKLARLAETPGHEDSWIDLAGYAACGAEINDSSNLAPGDRLLSEDEADEALKEVFFGGSAQGSMASGPWPFLKRHVSETESTSNHESDTVDRLVPKYDQHAMGAEGVDTDL